MSPFSSPLPSPLVSYFLSLERLSVPSGQSRNMPGLSSRDWGFPPQTRQGRLVLLAGCGDYAPIQSTSSLKVDWDIELWLRVVDSCNLQWHEMWQSLAFPQEKSACDWAPEVKFATAEQIMTIKLDKHIIKGWQIWHNVWISWSHRLTIKLL